MQRRAQHRVHLLCRTALGLAGAAVATLLNVGMAWSQNYVLEGGTIGADQVERGRQEYIAHCASCHGEDLHAVVSTAPDLTGSVFKYGWVNQHVGAKFDVISATMPAGKGGSLSDQVYADIVAYILSFNGVEATEAGELPADSEALGAIKIVAP